MPEHIKDVNTRYHDVAAAGYDEKWGIDFGPVGQGQVRDKLLKTLGGKPPRPFRQALEIGAGTGYFCLNLLQAGLLHRATATDISQGMLDELAATAATLGLEVDTVRTEAESLPFPDASFDLVFGHAVLHHIPDLERAFAEFHRVLRPDGILAFCGEPSRYGDRLASLPKRGGQALGPAWRALMRAGAREPDEAAATADGELESEVDVHAFAPSQLRRFAWQADLDEVRVRGEELVANLYGWLLRTMEATAEPEEIPRAWRQFAFRSYLALQRLDAVLLEPRLPAGAFYNLMIRARKPS